MFGDSEEAARGLEDEAGDDDPNPDGLWNLQGHGDGDGDGENAEDYRYFGRVHPISSTIPSAASSVPLDIQHLSMEELERRSNLQTHTVSVQFINMN